ncbi:hypothetical protein HBI23_250400 [Parastagonospora nodorum]|nr:hypothetical protein HBI23_250400 [Parastagonospora nodorum]KAH5621664.1 hypothetical protein HBI51_249570 [Parastagonospora nodorum]KAH6132816.1 hypothetical protein HBI68_255050 [Parastagonospora nodorum]
MHGRLPTCRWAKIIKRSQYPSWEGRLRVTSIFQDGPTNRERAAVVWKNGDRITYTATWLDVKCPRTMVWARKKFGAEVSRTTTEQLSGRASLLGTQRSERIGKTMKPQ